MSEFLVVGGRQVDIILKYVDVIHFRNKFQVLVDIDKALAEKGRRYNWNLFTWSCLWHVLGKKDRKFFGSKSKMIKQINFKEFDNIVSFINHEALGLPVEEKKEEIKEEDKESKNDLQAVS